MADRRDFGWPAGLVCLGLLGAGWFVGHGFEAGRSTPPSVTVKGLAERFVTADLAVWPLRFTATGNDLEAVQAEIDDDVLAVTAFLAEAGLPEAAIQPQRVEVTDLLAQPYRPEGVGDNRFIIAQTVLVRTDQVETIDSLGRQSGELVRRGVVLVETGGPTYLFTRLNEIKPEMLAAATRNAREAAEQFAEDADAGIGGIRSASQGLFQILPRDEVPMLPETAQLEKKIRVVSTITYELE
ncbi:MAG TPA: SIMPL domain-containing protein [Geminicoccaceae bacterium]